MELTPKRRFTCGLDATIAVMGGKWKRLILFALQNLPLRFDQLQRAVPGISERVLNLQQREMETASLVHGRCTTRSRPRWSTPSLISERVSTPQ